MKISSFLLSVAASLTMLIGGVNAQTMGNHGVSNHGMSNGGMGEMQVQPQIGHPLARHGRHQPQENAPGPTNTSLPPRLPPIIGDGGGTRSSVRPILSRWPEPFPGKVSPTVNYAPAPAPVPKIYPGPNQPPLR